MRKIQLLIVCLILGAFLTQGFQCASPTMTSAREAKKRGDFAKATENYEKEIKANPANADAYYELAETLQIQAMQENDFNKLKQAVDYVLEGKSKVKSQKSKDIYFNIEYNIWMACYNASISMMNQLGNKEIPIEQRKQNRGLIEYVLTKAIEIRPEIPDTYYMLGMAYVALEKNDKAIEAYTQHNDLYEKEFAFAKEKGIYHNMDRDAALSKLGSPKSSEALMDLFNYRKSKDPNFNDTVTIYTYTINNQELTVWSKFDSKLGKSLIAGWRFEAPSYTKRDVYDLNVSPTIELINLSLNNKDYATAEKNIELLKVLDPSNKSTNQMLINIYEAQGNPDKALQSIEKLSKENPEDASIKAQYGDILLRLKKFDQAIKAYEEAVKLDTTFNDVKRVLGSAYKNKAVDFQKAEIEKFDKDPKYKINENSYMPYLNKSLALFEELSKDPTYENDYRLFFELADIYLVMNETEKLNKTISRLARLEQGIEDQDKEGYYYAMYNLYDKTKNQEKLDEINKKLQELNK